MIFDSNVNTTSVDWNSIQESAYPLGLEGALMHVYENECNYNSIMKAAGIAEYKYYTENGGDLFVQEAGAAGGLLDRFIAFFRSVIKKIQEMFKKLFMKMSSYVASDKNFVKNYKKKVFANFKAFKFTGWKNFIGNDLPTVNTEIFSNSNKATADLLRHTVALDVPMSDDQVQTAIKQARAKVIKGTDNDMDTKDFQKALKEYYYGKEKEEFEVTSGIVADCFTNISDTKKDIKQVGDERDKITKGINEYIKTLESAKKELYDNITAENSESSTTRMSALSKKVELQKGLCSVATTAFGALIGAVKDRNRQSKAICVKALNSGSKKSTEESAMYGVEDIFAGVEII